MSIGEGIGQGLMFAAQNIAQNRKLKKQSEIENQQMAQRMQMQQQFAEQERARELERSGGENLATNQALLGLTGEKLPEDYDPNQLKMVAPSVFQSVLSKKEQAKLKQQEQDQKKLQAKIRTQFAAQYDKATPEQKNALLAEAENNGVDLLPFLQFQSGQTDKKTMAEERKAQQIADREDRQAFQSQQNSMYRRLASEVGKAARSGGGGKAKEKILKRFNPETNQYDFYDSQTGRPVGQTQGTAKPKSNLYAPIQVNYTPRR
jgi:hypothetical protein